MRELQNVMEHSATMAGGTEIGVRDLPAELQAAAMDGAPAGEPQFFIAKGRMVADFEREYLVNLLAENQFNISRAAEAAGCHRRTLYRMIHRHRINMKTIQEERRASRSGGVESVDSPSMSES